MQKFLLIVVAAFLLQPCVKAQSKKDIDYSTDILMFLPSAVGGVNSLVKGDYKGIVQDLESGAVTVATTYLL